jgi:hypothetical protein
MYKVMRGRVKISLGCIGKLGFLGNVVVLVRKRGGLEVYKD